VTFATRRPGGPGAHSRVRWGVVLAAGWLAAAAGEAAQDPAPVQIDIVSPQPGEAVQNRENLAPVSGRVQSGARGAGEFDVLVAIDASASTRFPSGIDVDEDGEVGVNPHEELMAPGSHPPHVVCTDPDDTILAAEVKAARLLLDVLDPNRTQVGVVTFSGEVDPDTGKRRSPEQQDARLVLPMVNRFDEVRAVLDEVLAEGPSGATNFAAAAKLAVVELAGLRGARSQPRPAARKVLLFLTDGVPTFPFGKGSSADPEDTEAAINAARLADKAGVTINAFALGRHALASPIAAIEMARITTGSYTPVRNPGDIVSFLRGVSFADVDDVVIINVSTGDVSYDVDLAPDGTFTGFVPVRPGANRIRVTALASDGGEQSVMFDLDFQKEGLSERELAREVERVRDRNRELMLLLERRRIENFRDRQRKRVEVEAEGRLVPAGEGDEGSDGEP